MLMLMLLLKDDESESVDHSSHTAQSSELTASASDRALSPLDVESFDNVAFFSLEKVIFHKQQIFVALRL